MGFVVTESSAFAFEGTGVNSGSSSSSAIPWQYSSAERGIKQERKRIRRLLSAQVRNQGNRSLKRGGARRTMEALSASLLLFAVTRYSLSTTLLRSRILSLLISNRPRATSAEHLTTIERLLLTLTDLGVRTFLCRFESVTYPTFQLSYSLLRRLLPTPPPLAFSIFSLSTPLPTLFFPFLLRTSPRRDALLEMPLPSLRTSILFSALWTLLHELLQLSCIATYRSTESRHSREARFARDKIMGSDRDKIAGIEIRGKPLVSSGGDAATTECSICLSSTFTPETTNPFASPYTPSPDTLEVFCTSCSTPLHPGCLMQWWHEKASQSPRRPAPNSALLLSRAVRLFPHLSDVEGPPTPAMITNGGAQEGRTEQGVDLVETNVGTGDGLSPLTRDLLVSLLREYGFTDGVVQGADGNYRIQVEIDGTRIRGFGNRGGGRRDESAGSVDPEMDAGCWGLGHFAKIIVDSPPHLPHLFPPDTPTTPLQPRETQGGGKEVVIYLSPKYVELRSAERSLWWWKFPQDGIELARTRSALIAAEREMSPESIVGGEEGKDPLIAVVVSNSAGNDPASPSGTTGPNCPLCRSSLTLYVHLVAPQKPSQPSSPTTIPLIPSLSNLAKLIDPIITSPLARKLEKKLGENSWCQLWSGSAYFGWKRVLRRWLIQAVLSGAIAGSMALSKRRGKA